MSAPPRIPIARLAGVFGVHGEFKVRVTPAGEDALHVGRSYALAADGDASAHVTVTAVRRHHDRVVIALDGIETPERAREFVGRELFAERASIALAPGEYLDGDLIGLALVDERGTHLARVIAVEHYPAQDCLVVEPGRALVPLVRAFVRAIDLDARTIVTSLPPGLLDSQAAEIDEPPPTPRPRRGRRPPE
jgi:16S rRNA processing protein RimM